MEHERRQRALAAYAPADDSLRILLQTGVTG